MNWACRAVVIGITASVFLLVVSSEQNHALGQKKDGKGKGKDHGPVHRYHHALEHAMKALKNAEKALLEADVKELNLANFNPLVSQKLTQGVQLVNNAYILASECRQVTPMASKKAKKAN